MNNNENLLRFFIYFFVLVLVLFSGYKYFEFKTIKDFVDFQNKAEGQEYRLVEKTDKLDDETTPFMNTFLGVEDATTTTKKVKKTDAQVLTENYDLITELINFNKVNIDISTEYNNLMKSNLQKYIGFNNKLKIILSQNSTLLKKYISSQIEYYNQEISNSDDNLVSLYFLENYFKVVQERLIVDNLSKTFLGKTKKYYSENYNMFSTLEKYTRSDFAYLKEDLIKTKRPYGYEWLDKNKKYFAAYYELIKEYTYGDEDSYNYKYEKFNTLIADFNIDMNKVFNENSSNYQQKAKDILKTVFDRYLIADKLKQNKFNIFPIFGKTNLINADLVMCQGYQYRYSLYKNIKDKYPEAKNVDDLIKEFDDVNLSNKEADSIFDKNLLNFSNSDKKVSFECKNQGNEASFNFTINK